MRLDAPDVDTLGRDHPEWRPWLVLLEATIEEIGERAWDRPALPAPPPPGTPRLAQGVLTVDATAAARWVSHLFRLAAVHSPGLAPLDTGALPDPLALLEAAILHDVPRIESMAAERAVEPRAFAAVVALAPVPLLQACARRVAPDLDASWAAGYCPVCGGWPTLAEARGVERDRRLRCGRCGTDWETSWLRCPYCDGRDHRRLGQLVSEVLGERCKVETCETCRGYLKSITTLTGAAPSRVLVEDLATVDLDVAALAEGYSRPACPGFALGLRVEPAAAPARGWLPWRR